MKHGPRKPCHASSVRATTSKECFSQKAGYESSFHKGTDFGGFPLTTGERSHHQFAGQDNSIMTGPVYRLGQILESLFIRFLYAGN